MYMTAAEAVLLCSQQPILAVDVSMCVGVWAGERCTMMCVS